MVELTDFEKLRKKVPLATLDWNVEEIRELLKQLNKRAHGALYFPFERSEKRPMGFIHRRSSRPTTTANSAS